MHLPGTSGKRSSRLGLIVRNTLQQQCQRQTLTGLPAVDGITVEAQQVLQGVVAVGVIDDHRSREIRAPAREPAASAH